MESPPAAPTTARPCGVATKAWPSAPSPNCGAPPARAASPAPPPTTPPATRTARRPRGSRAPVRAILISPRYTGYEIWDKQREQERLLDVDDVTLGHRTSMTHNPVEEWIRSNEPAHDAIISPPGSTLSRSADSVPATTDGRNEPENKARAPTPSADGSDARCASARCSPPPSATASATASNRHPAGAIFGPPPSNEITPRSQASGRAEAGSRTTTASPGLRGASQGP